MKMSQFVTATRVIGGLDGGPLVVAWVLVAGRLRGGDGNDIVLPLRAQVIECGGLLLRLQRQLGRTCDQAHGPSGQRHTHTTHTHTHADADADTHTDIQTHTLTYRHIH